MTHKFTILITTTRNLRYEAMNFATYQDALDFARNNISYTGDKIKRVELVESGIALRALWDSSWDKLSQHAGLYDSK